MSRIPGVASGIVSSVSDPANLGRVQVQFDWMDGAPQSYWARVAAPMAGGKRGAFFMPELNDEVLVSFDQGDVSSPYVVGYCWSGADQPPFDANLKQRGIMTVLGHQLLFNDDPAGSAITLSTPSGYALKLDEMSGSVSLTLPTGNKLVLDSTGLNVTVTGAVNVTAASVAVTAPTVTITAPTVTIDATTTNIAGSLAVGTSLTVSGVTV